MFHHVDGQLLIWPYVCIYDYYHTYDGDENFIKYDLSDSTAVHSFYEVKGIFSDYAIDYEITAELISCQLNSIYTQVTSLTICDLHELISKYGVVPVFFYLLSVAYLLIGNIHL